MKKAGFILLLFICCFSGYTMPAKLDSFYKAAEAIKDDSAKIRMYNKVATAYIFTDIKTADLLLKEGARLAKDKHFLFGQIELMNTRGVYMDVTGHSDSALFYFTRALKMSRKYHFTSIEMMCLNNLGMYNWNKGGKNEALQYFFKSLLMYEKAGREKETAIPLNNIGLIYQELKLPQKALEYHRRALALREKYQLAQEQITSLVNIGVCLKELGDITGAIAVLKKGITLAEKNNNRLEYPALHQNLADAYLLNRQDKLAIENYLLALKGIKEQGLNEKRAFSIYSDLIVLYNRNNDPRTALSYAKKGFELLQQNKDLEKVTPQFFLNAAETRYMFRDFDTARSLRDKFIDLYDSLFSEKTAQAVMEYEIKYETEKKEKQLLQHKAMIATQQLLVQKKNYVILGIVILALVLGGIAILLFKHQKLKSRQTQREHEYKLTLSKMESQKKLQEQKMSISRELHDNIGAYTSALLSELQLIKPSEAVENKNLQDLIFYSRHIMTNLRETIWTLSREQLTLTAWRRGYAGSGSIRDQRRKNYCFEGLSWITKNIQLPRNGLLKACLCFPYAQ